MSSSIPGGQPIASVQLSAINCKVLAYFHAMGTANVPAIAHTAEAVSVTLCIGLDDARKAIHVLMALGLIARASP